jgi:hypothetical protein
MGSFTALSPCRPEAKPKDLTPAARSVSMARVWSFGEVLRFALDDMNWTA